MEGKGGDTQEESRPEGKRRVVVSVCSLAAMAERERDAVEQVRSWLQHVVRVTLSDGRVVEGKLQCFDNLGNMILGHAVQIPSATGRRVPVRLGLVLAPGDNIVSVCVRREVSDISAALAALEIQPEAAKEAPSVL